MHEFPSSFVFFSFTVIIEGALHIFLLDLPETFENFSYVRQANEEVKHLKVYMYHQSVVAES